VWYTPTVVQAWFQGLNPQLEDRSPARLLREGDLDEVGPPGPHRGAGIRRHRLTGVAALEMDID